MFLKSICRFKDVSMNPRDVVMAVLCHLEMIQEHQWPLNDIGIKGDTLMRIILKFRSHD